MADALSGAASGAAAGSAFGPWGTAIGGVLGLASGLLGKKKAAATAPYTPVDLQKAQRQAIEGNLINQGGIEALLDRANSFESEQALELMEKAMPGYGKLASRLTGLTNELLTNPYDLPADVEKNLERQAAERGIAVGGGGKFSEFSLLRDLGLNQISFGQSRIAQAQGLTGLLASLAPKVNPMSPMSFYVNPGQTAQIAAGNNAATQEIAQSGLNASAAAGNANRQSLWDGIGFAGGLFSDSLGSGTSTRKRTGTGQALGGQLGAIA